MDTPVLSGWTFVGRGNIIVDATSAVRIPAVCSRKTFENGVVFNVWHKQDALLYFTATTPEGDKYEVKTWTQEAVQMLVDKKIIDAQRLGPVSSETGLRSVSDADADTDAPDILSIAIIVFNDPDLRSILYTPVS